MFKFIHEENLFMHIFEKLIDNVAFGRLVSREMILKIIDAEKFAPLLQNLKFSYPEGDINQKIINKVRTLGYSRRLADNLGLSSFEAAN